MGKDKNLMKDKSVKRFRQLAGLQEDQSVVTSDDFEDRWDLVDTILKYLEPKELVNELVKALGKSESMETLDYIARMNNIYYHEEIGNE